MSNYGNKDYSFKVQSCGISPMLRESGHILTIPTDCSIDNECTKYKPPNHCVKNEFERQHPLFCLLTKHKDFTYEVITMSILGHMTRLVYENDYCYINGIYTTPVHALIIINNVLNGAIQSVNVRINNIVLIITKYIIYKLDNVNTIYSTMHCPTYTLCTLDKVNTIYSTMPDEICRYANFKDIVEYTISVKNIGMLPIICRFKSCSMNYTNGMSIVVNSSNIYKIGKTIHNNIRNIFKLPNTILYYRKDGKNIVYAINCVYSIVGGFLDKPMWTVHIPEFSLPDSLLEVVIS